MREVGAADEGRNGYAQEGKSEGGTMTDRVYSKWTEFKSTGNVERGAMREAS